MEKSFTAIGLMSGTSMDGVDGAIIRTDGRNIYGHGQVVHLAYDPAMRDVLRHALKIGPTLKKGRWPSNVKAAEQAITDAHITAVKRVLELAGLQPRDIDFVGFHGQTVFHDSSNRLTIQIGDAQRLADETGIDVIADFRSADVKAGGEGAPLAPLYHQAILRESGITDPAVVVNIGGVSNVTWILNNELIAFDTGPGNALIDDWMTVNIDRPYDEFGAIGMVGHVHTSILEKLMTNEYFTKKPPKSLDRNAFSNELIAPLSIEDGAATLAAFTAATIARSSDHFVQEPRGWIICGGGRHNCAIMRELEMRLPGSVQTAEEAGLRGDDIEAEAIAFLAVRSYLGLPLSYPGTTGVPKPQTGGRLFEAKS